MQVLLDTQVLLWAIAEPGRIPRDVRRRLETPENTVLFSAASIWELAIKLRIGRISLPVTLERLIEVSLTMGFVELPVTAIHAAGVERLPLHHRDPFDRVLISQAILEPAHLLTADQTLDRYSELVALLR